MSKKRSTQNRRHRVARGKKKKSAQIQQGCPTPMKTAFTGFDTAVYSITRAGHAGQGWGVYECVCGWWHVTSSPGRLLRQFDEEIYRSANYEYAPYDPTTSYIETKKQREQNKDNRGSSHD